MTVRPASITSSRAAVTPIAASGERVNGNPVRRTVLKACSALAAWIAFSRVAQAVPEPRVKWIVFYGQSADEQVLSSYDIVVLDPMFRGSITAVAKSGAGVCSYLSLGEIRKSDAFYNRVDSAALLEENPDWPGTRRIDVRCDSWKELVIGEVIPSIAAKGFTGLLLDTLDTPPYLEQLDSRRYQGMRQAAVDLVGAINKSFPSMSLIMNRGYALLPRVIDNIDAVVAEGLLTTVGGHGDGSYKWNDPSEVALQLSLLASGLHQRARLPILSLDYWDPGDTGTVREIYRRERQSGHHPYVGTRLLDRIIPEPFP